MDLSKCLCLARAEGTCPSQHELGPAPLPVLRSRQVVQDFHVELDEQYGRRRLGPACRGPPYRVAVLRDVSNLICIEPSNRRKNSPVIAVGYSPSKASGSSKLRTVWESVLYSFRGIYGGLDVKTSNGSHEAPWLSDRGKSLAKIS